MAGKERIELSITVLETVVIPLNYFPISLWKRTKNSLNKSRKKVNGCGTTENKTYNHKNNPIKNRV